MNIFINLRTFKFALDVAVGSEVKSDTTVLLGVIGATGAFLVVAVIIGIVVLKYRRKGRYC